MAEHVGGTPREGQAVEPQDLEAALVAWAGIAAVNVAHAWQGRQRR